jgi:hypothetical protein
VAGKIPAFAEMLGRFCLNRARQSDDENRRRHFRLGADYQRIRDLFGCSVDALGILSPRARSRHNGCRTCAQTRLGPKPGLGTSANKDRPEAVSLWVAPYLSRISLAVPARRAGLRWRYQSLNLAIWCRDWSLPLRLRPWRRTGQLDLE